MAALIAVLVALADVKGRTFAEFRTAILKKRFAYHVLTIQGLYVAVMGLPTLANVKHCRLVRQYFTEAPANVLLRPLVLLRIRCAIRLVVAEMARAIASS